MHTPGPAARNRAGEGRGIVDATTRNAPRIR